LQRWINERIEEKMFRLLTVVAILAMSAAQAAEPLMGRASVVDGDTIDIHGTRIRLEGIDAPESRQTCKVKDTGEVIRCGQKAAFYLSDMIGEHSVSCTEDGRDRYGRTLAHCEVAGQDVSASMVRAGWALAFRRYSVEYVPQEDEARAAGAGIWATEFVPPWDWRKGQR
jgi:endonuclease YncB( thermonuclease family)